MKSCSRIATFALVIPGGSRWTKLSISRINEGYCTLNDYSALFGLAGLPVLIGSRFLQIETTQEKEREKEPQKHMVE
jgi:hypothetical protein